MIVSNGLSVVKRRISRAWFFALLGIALSEVSSDSLDTSMRGTIARHPFLTVGIFGDCLSGIQSKEELRFEHVAEQGLDTSCGYSAAATLLSRYWGIEAEEEDLIDRLAPDGDGFVTGNANMAILSGLLRDYGLDTRGLRLDWAALARILPRYAPALVHFGEPDKHFALALAIEGERVVVADPVLGLRVVHKNEFMERWSGVALVVDSATRTKLDDAIDRATETAFRKMMIADEIAGGGRTHR